MKYRSHLLLCTAIAGCAFIQTAAAQSNKQTAAAPQAAAATVGLEEITVSARKTDERIIDVPLALTAITAGQIEDRGMVDFNDIAAITPGLTVQNLSVGRNDRAFRVYIIRGMIPGNGLATRATVSTFVDGALVFGGNMSNLADVERIETVKGPQAAYFGRGSFAGAINFVTKEPRMAEWGGRISADIGSHDFKNLTGSVEGPVIADKLAIRLAATSYYQGGQYENPGRAGSDLGQRSTKSVSANFVFHATDAFKIKGFSTIYHDSDGPNASGSYQGPNNIQAGNSYNCNLNGGTGNNYICGKLGPIPYTTRSQANYIEPTYLAQAQRGFLPTLPDLYPFLGENFCNHVGLCRTGSETHVNGEYELENGIVLSANGSWDINHWAYTLAGSSNPFGPVYPNPNYGTAVGNGYEVLGYAKMLPYTASLTLGQAADKDENAEFRVTLPEYGIFKGLVGFNYFHNYSDNQTPGYSNNGPGATSHSSFVNHTYGAFGALTADLGGFIEGLSITGEARHQWEEIWQTTRASATPGAPYPVFDNHNTSFTPRVIVEYKPNVDLTYYASYSVGSRAIEFNTNYFTLTAAQQAQIAAQVPVAGVVPQDKVKMGEVGVKGVVLDNTLRILIDGYYGQWTGRHIPNTLTYTLANGQPGSLQVSAAGGIVDLYGIEAEATWQATKELSFDGTLNYAETDIRATNCGDCLAVTGNKFPVGTRLPYYPAWTATFAPTYKRHAFSNFDGFVTVEYAYRGRIYDSEGNYAWTAPTHKLNASFGIENSTYRVAIWGKNIFDNKTATSISRSTYTNVNATTGVNIPGQIGLNSIAVSLPDKQAFGVRASMNF